VSRLLALASGFLIGESDRGLPFSDFDDAPFGQAEDFAFCLLASGGVRYASQIRGRSRLDFFGSTSRMPASPNSAQEHQLGFLWTDGWGFLRLLECSSFLAPEGQALVA
jgi:hypothetical protein